MQLLSAAAVVLALGLALASACSPGSSAWRTAAVSSGGEERYSAWFADADAHDARLYFGLSPFWELWWSRGGDARADLDRSGDWLIGRYDLRARRFLTPLRVASGRRSTIWDVLAHRNGWIYFTTFYEEMGRVHATTGDVELFAHLGAGHNELVEAADGRIWVSRYAGGPGPSGGSVVVLEPDGRLLREIPLPGARAGETLAPKALGLAPGGDLWLAVDVFAADGGQGQTALHIGADGALLERRDEPELLFAAFDERGRGWFVEDRAGRALLRVVSTGSGASGTSEGSRESRELRESEGSSREVDLGARARLDFAQDIHFDRAGRALITFWSGRLVAAELDDSGALRTGTLSARPDNPCRSPRGHALFHSGVLSGRRLAVTVSCDRGAGAVIYDAPAPAMLGRTAPPRPRGSSP